VTSASWEEVLAGFQVSTEHAEKLIAHDPDAGRADAVAYDIWSMNLPPIPPELRERAELIHRRQQTLADELRASLRTVAQQLILSDSGLEPRRPAFVDHRA
jgi:hypothetical protein